LEAEEIFVRFFLIAFLNSPCYETPKNVIQKKSNKTTEGEKKTEGKKTAFFVMSPWIFSKQNVFVFLNSPCYETPKNAFKKSIRNKNKNKIEQVTAFVLALRTNARHFRRFFPHGAPCSLGAPKKVI
jgi:hypothetical protein